MIGQRAATLIGGTAVLMWSSLALLTAASGKVPPFQLMAMSFLIASLLGAVKWLVRGERATTYLRQPLPVWLLGIGGLFGFHFFYFMALRNAPAVEASLIAYVWPLLIVLFSALLPEERLRWWHLAGAALGFAGCALIATGGGAVVFRMEYALGYASAFACGVTWAGYSVLSRRFKSVPTDTVAWFCVVTAFLGLVCHLIFETTVWPQDAVEWLAVLLLGLGPVGAAFFVWDYGVKHGDIRALGVFSYSAPLISTLLLILFGRADATWVVGLACVAIVGGALLASRDILSRSARKAKEA